MMVESEANELSEEIMLGAVLFAHDACREVVKAIIALAEKAKDRAHIVEGLIKAVDILDKSTDTQMQIIEAETTARSARAELWRYVAAAEFPHNN